MDPRIDQLRDHLREEPSSRRFFQLGDLLRKVGELGEAIEVLSSGLENHPRYVAAWVSLGRAQAECERWGEAEASFARALQYDPENAVAARLIGEVAEKSGDNERAFKAYQLAQALTPGDSDLAEAVERIEAALRGETTAPMGPALEAEVGETDAPFDEPDEPGEPFAAPPADPEPFADPPTEPFSVAPPAPRKAVVAVEHPSDDPFAVSLSAESGVWEMADDVFMTPEAADAAARALEEKAAIDEPVEVATPVEEAEEAFAEVPESVVEGAVDAPQLEEAADTSDPFAIEEGPVAGEPEEQADGVDELVPEIEEPPAEAEEHAAEMAEPAEDEAFADETVPAEELALEEPEEPAAFEAGFEPEPEPLPMPAPEQDAAELAPPDEQETLPMHTVTLARLAVDQGDIALARETLEGLLVRDPDNAEAQELLSALDAPAVDDEVPADAELPAPITSGQALAAKTQTLKAWMEAVRLAADRRAP
jgi:tetratricopeptide (TPR) repeat protein